MKKTTILSLTTVAVILAAYVPNEPILADTPSSEVIKETKVGSIIQQNNIKYKVLTVEGNIGTVQVGNGVTPVEFEAGQDGKPFTIPTKITVGDKVFTVTEVASQAFSYYPDETGRIVYPNHSYLSQLDVTYKTPDLMSHFLPPHEVSFTFCCSSIVFPR
ncbi:choline binding protein PcpA [Streptococcus pneumoniae]|nr:choline binding protein PcpA [Streptococcus pneumoniae]